MARQVVSRTVKDEEIIVRGLVDPLFWSHNKKKFKKEAFMPPPNSNDVSVLRLIYTDDHACKRHASSLQIPNNVYVGLAVVLSKDIRSVNNAIPNNEVGVDVVCTPLDIENKVVPKNKVVYKEDQGLPMHADILYSEANVREEVGNPREKIGQISMAISKFAKGENDPDPSSNDWKGPSLSSLLE